MIQLELPSGNLTYPLNMAIDIVSFPIELGDFPKLCQRLPEGKSHKIH